MNTTENTTMRILEATTATEMNRIGWDLTTASNKKEINIDQFLLLRSAVSDKREELGLAR